MLLIISGTARMTFADTQTKPPAKNETNTLSNDIKITDIHDIKSLENFGVNPAIFWYAALGFLALVLVAAGLVYWKKKRQVNAASKRAFISPEENALNQLDSLQPLMEAEGKKFYFKLSIILREYLWQRFGIGAPEMTTEELLPRIAELDIDSGLVWGVRAFAQASDPVKFADKPADLSEMERHIGFVRSFVKQTTPTPEIDVEAPQTDNQTISNEIKGLNPQPVTRNK
jgi:hypothetical protein